MEKALVHRLIEKYYIVKDVYVLCEEVDYQLNTNVQPLNEFRAALDHIFRILIADSEYEIEQKPNIESEANKLLGHLNRAYFDICESLCANFRLKISEAMRKYSDEDIRQVIPEYYQTIKPYIDSCETRIARIRLDRGIEYGERQEALFEEFKEIVDNLKDYYLKIIGSSNEIGAIRDLKKCKRKRVAFNIASLSIGIVGIIVGLLGWLLK